MSEEDRTARLAAAYNRAEQEQQWADDAAEQAWAALVREAGSEDEAKAAMRAAGYWDKDGDE